jgi:hypothetical protein
MSSSECGKEMVNFWVIMKGLEILKRGCEESEGLTNVTRDDKEKKRK